MSVTQVGDVIYIEVPAGVSGPTAFWVGSSRYFMSSNGLWFREWVNPKGLTSRELADVRFSRGLPAFAIPVSQRLRPIPIWPKPSTGPAFSFHIDAMRWVRIFAYIDEDGALEIPLLDAAGKPWFGMGVPPKFIIRRNNSTNTDDMAAPEAAGLQWEDIGIGWRPGGPFNTANRTFGTTQQLQMSLKAMRDPVPHWVMRIQSAFISSNNRTYMIDLFSEGGGAHASAAREVGSAGTVGHWKATLMWSPQPFKLVTARNILNERKFGQGSIDVPNDPAPGFTPVTLYLTTGANKGLATGTALFTVLPAVAVFGNSTIGAYASSTETTWEPESWGMGASDLSAGAITGSGAEKAYNSRVYKDAVSGHYAVDIYNIGANVGGGAPSAALDRTFFAFSVGT